MLRKQLALSASSLDDIFQSILRISQAIGLADEGKAVVQREQERLDRVKQEAARSVRKTVVMLEWTDPLFAMGNWGPELVEIANGELLLGEKGEYSAAIPAEQLRDANPEYLIVAPCGFNLERSLREQAVLERYPWWRELQAVRKGNVAFADGNLFFNRSGMTISQTAEIIAEILHGRPFGETQRRNALAPDRILCAAGFATGDRKSNVTKVALSWSSGKDSAWTLHVLRQQPDIQVAALITTFNSEADRVAMHAVRRALVEAQAERTGLPLWAVELPWPCSNEEYEHRMRAVCQRAKDEGITAIAFGDLFLEDVRDYRIRQLARQLGSHRCFRSGKFPPIDWLGR